MIFLLLDCIYCEDRAPSDDNCCIESIWIANNTYNYLLSLIGIRNYTLKSPLLVHSYREPPVTQITYSPGDSLRFGPSSKFKRHSYATALTGEKRSLIIGTLRY